jgi:hypothetical protein
MSVEAKTLAGFGKATITPPLGTPMQGWTSRDRVCGNVGIMEDLFVRIIYLHDGKTPLLIASYDLLALNRHECDRLKGMLSAKFDLLARQILINYTHSHNSVRTSDWICPDIPSAGEPYFQMLEMKTVAAVQQAIKAAVPVTLSAAVGETTLPVNRRLPTGNGSFAFAPNPGGEIQKNMPLLVARNAKGKIAAMFFAVGCHPTTKSGHLVNNDYVGAALRKLTKELKSDNILMLQGCAGDAKPDLLNSTTFIYPTWDFLEKGGEIVRKDVMKVMNSGRLKEFKADFSCALTEFKLPYEHVPNEAEVKKILEAGRIADPYDVKDWENWAKLMEKTRECFKKIPDHMPVLTQLINFGKNIRLIAVEGETVSGLGKIMEEQFKSGTTFALGYSNGYRMYFITSEQQQQNSYEKWCYFTYNIPSTVKPGIEKLLANAISELKEKCKK